MASVVETKAVAIRRGTHAENLAFTGVQGEVTADLGFEDENGNLGTDGNATLRLHNGITRGGIPMARADMSNVSSQVLAENRTLFNDKNMAYADLTNLEPTTSESARKKIADTFSSYGLVNEEDFNKALETKANVRTDNINTADLASEVYHNDANSGNLPLAYANTSNINTADLANVALHDGSPSKGKALTYSDLSNADTSSITSLSHDNGPIVATNNMSNVNTTNLTKSLESRPEEMSGPVLARADLSNVDENALNNALSQGGLGVERIANKDVIIDEFAITPNHYPETSAVVDFVNGKLSGSKSGYANTTLTNIDDWSVLYDVSNNPILSRRATVVSSQNGFEVGENYETGILLKQDSLEEITVRVKLNGDTISELKIEDSVGTQSLARQNPFYIVSETNTKAVFTITSTRQSDGTYKYTMGNISAKGSGFRDGNSYVIYSSTTDEPCQVAYKQLEIIVTSLVEEGGAISTVSCEPEVGMTSVDVGTIDIFTESGAKATISIENDIYNNTGGAGLAKADFTNLRGMKSTDIIASKNAPWRVNPNIGLSPLSGASSTEEDRFTLATCAAMWKVLKPIFNAVCTDLTLELDSTSTKSLDDFSIKVVSGTEESFAYSSGAITCYALLPNRSYTITVTCDGVSGTETFTTGTAGSVKRYKYSADTTGVTIVAA